MEILIYKTNLSSNKKVRHIKSALNSHPHIINWTVDREDIDNVLRIEATQILKEKELRALMKRFGIFCEELLD